LDALSVKEDAAAAAGRVMKQDTVSVYRKYARGKALVIASVAAAIPVLAITAMTLGSARISPLDVLYALMGQAGQRTAQIVIHIRLPRVLASMIAGMGLALAGCIIQNVLRNPLASDYTLGISQGAAFGAALAILAMGAGSVNAAGAGKDALLISNPYIVTLSAFSGAMLLPLPSCVCPGTGE
jgi:iron complex transport system permease protein